MKRVFALFAALIPLASQFTAAEEALLNIRIEMQIVVVPDEFAVPLVADLADEQKIEPAYARIQELLAKGVAKLIGWPTVTTHSGQRAVVEAVNEIRYATRYSEPTISITPSTITKGAVEIEPTVDVRRIEATPESFETRNAGVTLEVEPVVSPDGERLHIVVTAQHVQLKGFNKITIEKPATGAQSVVEQPEFHAMKVTTSLTLRNGQRMLMGVYRISDPAKHLEFFILKAEAKKVE